eukprot:337451-Rhodomonas_salina.1
MKTAQQFPDQSLDQAVIRSMLQDRQARADRSERDRSQSTPEHWTDQPIDPDHRTDKMRAV